MHESGDGGYLYRWQKFRNALERQLSLTAAKDTSIDQNNAMHATGMIGSVQDTCQSEIQVVQAVMQGSMQSPE